MVSEIGYLAAISAGIISFLSPCVLPLVPAYLGFIAGNSIKNISADESVEQNISRKATFAALAFIGGFSTVFLILGASASAIHVFVYQYVGILSKIAGVLIVIFGLHYLGLFRSLSVFRFLERDVRFHNFDPPANLFGSFLIGVAFAFGWTPCIGPILATILIFAGSSDSLNYGVSLLAAYSLGLGIPFLIAAIALPAFIKFSIGFRKYIRLIERAAGLLLIVTGVSIYFNLLSVAANFLLDTFPFFLGLG